MAGPEALADIQNSLSNPELVLGQSAPRPGGDPTRAHRTRRRHDRLHRLGDGLNWRVADRLLRDGHRGAPATRVEADASDQFVERILGLELDAEQYDRGTAFASGVVERAGAEGLRRLFDDPAHLPTPNEVDAPGLGWPGSIYRAESSGRSGARCLAIGST